MNAWPVDTGSFSGNGSICDSKISGFLKNHTILKGSELNFQECEFLNMN